MKQKDKIGLLVPVVLGVIGSFASLLSIPNPTLRWILLTVSVLLIVIGLAVALNDMIHLASAWSVLRSCRRLGIIRIHPDGKSGVELPERVMSSRSIKIMSVSGIVLIRLLKDELVAALRNGCYIKVLLGTSASDFVKDVEEAESSSRLGQIGPELDQVEKLLEEYLADADRGNINILPGKIEIVHFRTQLRSSIMICDNAWGKLTLNLPPKRSIQTPSIEMEALDGGLLADCIQHFDQIWQLSKVKGLVRAVQPMSLTESKERIHCGSKVEAIDKSADLHRDSDAFVMSAKGETSTKSFLEWAGGERVTLAIVFTDVVGATALGTEMGDEAMNEVRRAHFAQSRKLIAQFKGREIKTIGDSFMVAFKSADAALDYSMALHRNTGHPNIQIRAGIHIGPTHVVGGEIFGGTVNFAARVVVNSRGPEIWLSDRAKDDIDRLGAEQYEQLGWQRHDGVAMKGFPGTFTLWSLQKHPG